MADQPWRTDLKTAFARFDADRSGKIDRREFDQLLNELGSSMPEREREIGFALIDTDEDGAITCDELAAWWEIVREEGQSGS